MTYKIQGKIQIFFLRFLNCQRNAILPTSLLSVKVLPKLRTSSLDAQGEQLVYLWPWQMEEQKHHLEKMNKTVCYLALCFGLFAVQNMAT